MSRNRNVSQFGGCFRLSKATRWVGVLFIACGLGAGTLVPTQAWAVVQIIACGTISSRGLYELVPSLATSSGDCIVIAASDVTLELLGNVTGGGSTVAGAGIHIVKTTSTGLPVKNVFVAGVGSTISGFTAGIQDDADRAIGTNVTLSGNMDGLLINGAKDSDFGDFAATGNSGAGVHIVGGASNTLDSFSSTANAKYGVWIQSSSDNKLDDFDATGNTIAGVYLGCNPAFSGTGSTCSVSSKNNFIFVAGASSNAKFGIAVDLGDTFNKIADNTAMSNTVDDALDLNSTTCSSNQWFGSVYSKVSPTCIH